MNVQVYDPVEQPTLHAMYEDMERNPGGMCPDMWALLGTVQELDDAIERIQLRYVNDVCAKYNGKYVSSIGHMTIYLADAIRHAAIRLEQVPEDLRAVVERACRELEARSS